MTDKPLLIDATQIKAWLGDDIALDNRSVESTIVRCFANVDAARSLRYTPVIDGESVANTGHICLLIGIALGPKKKAASFAHDARSTFQKKISEIAVPEFTAKPALGIGQEGTIAKMQTGYEVIEESSPEKLNFRRSLDTRILQCALAATPSTLNFSLSTTLTETDYNTEIQSEKRAALHSMGGL